MPRDVEQLGDRQNFRQPSFHGSLGSEDAESAHAGVHLDVHGGRAPDLARRAARGSRSPEALARRLDRLGFSSRSIVARVATQ